MMVTWPHQHPHFRAFARRDDFERATLAVIQGVAKQSIESNGRFVLVLAGGRTPRSIYQALCSIETDWSAWWIYFGDERCLPPTDPERNSRMAADAWLDVVPIPSEQIHVIPAELGPERAAELYSQRLAEVGSFDLVLLGLGEDGHTASLFPGGDWEHETHWPDAIPVHGAPKPPQERVSLSPARLSYTRRCLYLVAGSDKQDAVFLWCAGGDLPASRIAAIERVDVFTLIGSDSTRSLQSSAA
ncbi:6-phosphogluconolactonase [Thiorhodococcus drewsii AZ1]|uniref:6-phosphogluconolactonase n=1 Tax=Thiorhodococcus drewsii AZ1 TaxID=765913 RepID=G2E6K1_9GAMM|nr:6-phosphogluconolactonase [Thiorhodococcus drewsii]EGV28285.1 6-phosphogluconolactonase [Thiorhodococcus drewsii AZ1]